MKFQEEMRNVKVREIEAEDLDADLEDEEIDPP